MGPLNRVASGHQTWCLSLLCQKNLTGPMQSIRIHVGLRNYLQKAENISTSLGKLFYGIVPHLSTYIPLNSMSWDKSFFPQYGFSNSVLCFSTGICSRWLSCLVLCFFLSNCASFAHILINPCNLPLNAILLFQCLCLLRDTKNDKKIVFGLGTVNWSFILSLRTAVLDPSHILYSTSQWSSSATSQAAFNIVLLLTIFFLTEILPLWSPLVYKWSTSLPITPDMNLLTQIIFKIEEKQGESIYEM